MQLGTVKDLGNVCGLFWSSGFGFSLKPEEPGAVPPNFLSTHQLFLQRGAQNAQAP